MKGNENHSAFDLFQRVYDYRVVRPSEIPQGPAVRGDRGEVTDCVRRVFFQVPANRIGNGEFTAYQL
jgi:hypothetical protein